MEKTGKKFVNAKPPLAGATNTTEGAVDMMAQEARYRNVPLDIISHKQLMALCEARGFGQRGQGALVRILIKKEFEAMKKSGILK